MLDVLLFQSLPYSLETGSPTRWFSTCGSKPLGGFEQTFHRGFAHQIAHVSDIYLMVDNSSKMTVTK